MFTHRSPGRYVCPTRSSAPPSQRENSAILLTPAGP